jgi:hypothetical protein
MTMNVSKNLVYNELKKQEPLFVDNDHRWKIALEPIERNWNYKDINDLQTKLAQYEEFESYRNDDTLEVHAIGGNVNLVLVIEGLENIARYCENNILNDNSHAWYQHTEVSKASITKHYNLNMISTIICRKSTDIKETDWENMNKRFYQKRKIGYTHLATGIAYTFEVMRGSNNAFCTMKEARISSEDIQTGIYVEMPTDVKLTKEKDTTDKVKALIKYTLFLYKELTGEAYPLVISEQTAILTKYSELIKSVYENKKYRMYLTPKPVTLERKNLMDPDKAIGVLSVLKNYAVTDKADGERMLLFIDDKGEAYFINGLFQVKKLGVQAKNVTNTLLDGEYISSHLLKSPGQKSIFAIFDIYFMKTQNLMILPLMASVDETDKSKCRYAKMKEVSDKNIWTMNDADIVIEMKQHFAANGADMFNKCHDVYNANKLYNKDGLIFTPVDLQVFADYPNTPKKLTGKSVAWDKVFKWKPPEQNTIDFLVTLDKNGDHFVSIKGTTYKRFILHTGYNPSQWEEISIEEGVERVYTNKPTQSRVVKPDEYTPRVFKPDGADAAVSIALIPVNIFKQAVSQQNEIIENDTIVEMSYTPGSHKNPSLCWKATRVREDKTKIYRNKKESLPANDLSVALNIWDSIHAPVTLDDIIGNTTISFIDAPVDIDERLLSVNDIYYARDNNRRNNMLSVNMLNFHNHGIKAMLYGKSEKNANGRKMLLELACGMAGDLPRWRDNNFTFVLGVDLVKHNIVAPSGAYSRILNRHHHHHHHTTLPNNFTKAIFVVGDCARPLETGEAADQGSDSETLLRMLHGMKTSKDTFKYLDRYKVPGMVKTHKFDMVSCQFAIHYFFQSSKRIDGFMGNVSRNLKNGGLFIATFMDGEKVDNLIKSTENNAVGKKGDRHIWAIQKEYKSFTKKSPYGKLINVYLENTRRFIPEYLVHFDVLCAKAEEFGLVLQENASFETTFNYLLQKVKAGQSLNNSSDADLLFLENDEVQKKFSFLNHWVVFRKLDAEST